MITIEVRTIEKQDNYWILYAENYWRDLTTEKITAEKITTEKITISNVEFEGMDFTHLTTMIRSYREPSNNS